VHSAGLAQDRQNAIGNLSQHKEHAANSTRLYLKGLKQRSRKTRQMRIQQMNPSCSNSHRPGQSIYHSFIAGIALGHYREFLNVWEGGGKKKEKKKKEEKKDRNLDERNVKLFHRAKPPRFVKPLLVVKI
jgi:hypothetical protein